MSYLKNINMISSVQNNSCVYFFLTTGNNTKTPYLLATLCAVPQNDDSRFSIPSFLKMHHNLLQFQYVHLCASGEVPNCSHRHSHIVGGTNTKHESWLPQEVPRDLPHCLCSSITQPESSITYGMS